VSGPLGVRRSGEARSARLALVLGSRVSTDEDVTTGSARTEADAWAAIARTARAARVVHLSVHHGWAQRKASQFARAARSARPPRCDGQPEVAPLEFAWTHEYFEDGRPYTSPHLIVKRTARFFFVEQDSYDLLTARRAQRLEHGVSDQEDYVRYGRPTYRLPRAEFEQNQGVYSDGRWYQTFYARPPRMDGIGEDWIREHCAEALAALGLAWPYTSQALEAAYRRLVKRAHPDQGGTAAKFFRVRAAYGILPAVIAHYEDDADQEMPA
jgi:hypothetical protein